MNKDELKGKAKDLKGRLKEGAGDMTDNERLEPRDRCMGTAQRETTER